SSDLRVIDVGLYRSTQRTSAVLLIKSFTQQQISYLIANHKLNLLFTETRTNLIKQQINNFVEFWLTQSMEDHYLVNTVNELWTEHTLQPFHRFRTDDFVMLIARILIFCRQETNAHCPLHVSTTSITG